MGRKGKSEQLLETRAERLAARTPKGNATRARILDAVARVFVDVGYDRARMAELIAATGMTKGAVYFYFDSKEALALAVLERKHQQWLSTVERRLRSLPSGLARLEGLTAAMVDLHRTSPDAWAVTRLTMSLAEVPSARPRAAELNGAWVQFVADLVRAAQATGEVRTDVDPREVAATLVAAFDGLKLSSGIHHDSVERDHRLAAAAGLLERMVFSYLAPPRRDPARS